MRLNDLKKGLEVKKAGLYPAFLVNQLRIELRTPSLKGMCSTS